MNKFKDITREVSNKTNIRNIFIKEIVYPKNSNFIDSNLANNIKRYLTDLLYSKITNAYLLLKNQLKRNVK